MILAGTLLVLLMAPALLKIPDLAVLRDNPAGEPVMFAVLVRSAKHKPFPAHPAGVSGGNRVAVPRVVESRYGSGRKGSPHPA